MMTAPLPRFLSAARRVLLISFIFGAILGPSAKAADCCDGLMRGDANLSSLGESIDFPTIGDVSAMIDALFITGDCIGPDPENPIIACLTEADVNGSAEQFPVTCDDITIGDVSAIIDYLFIETPNGGQFVCDHCPPDCRSGFGLAAYQICSLRPCPESAQD